MGNSLTPTNSMQEESGYTCSHAANCELYGQFLLKSALRIWQVRYCQSETKSKECARYRASLEGRTVPITLLPNGKTLTT
mgnify:CR=1 FL=1